MSKGALREDKYCLNCGTYVQGRFCPLCGQENTETRKSFHYLFTHTAEDLVHYDSGFWTTIKYLLFHPARLTREYLSGRRKAYVVPVKLYIFISFITFFITSFFINLDDMTVNDKSDPVAINETAPKEFQKKKGININYSTESPVDEKVISNSGEKVISNSAEKIISKNDEYGWVPGCESVRELDSVQNSLPENKRMSKLQYWFTKRLVMIAEHNTMQEAFRKSVELFIRNLPKLLFFYMPFFAFWLWLVHGKKRWYYFDHGIFTLHYFSFLLLLTSIFMILAWLLNMSDWLAMDIILGLLFTVYMFWPIIYFYKAHKRLYGESKIISFLKSSALFLINFTTFWIILALYSLYTFMSIH
ncbi:hypothetical protein FEDK69T_01190 [Flavobacterium enshiense DK69]|uniref:DUF3667 domain-containing protein n=1 Tax=Flavobacterium enshiense DK69 TaxID=1107311 RepID=V6SFZ1_9FLAO|nr:DUF3667 domain-containing protein [Flavobacterium enshiense]ESU25152.1 hypothetical protein FEDK69T_01190 [Flavobacterium enshiense DK69]KGO96953.1 hypothetical protein Q767_04460 [Flavobacterium enshiense DK69]